MKNLLAWAVIIPGSLVLYYFTETLKKRKIMRLMSGRKAYMPQEFGEHYFPADQAEVATRFSALLSNYVPIDLARLNPDDRLVQDLGIGQVDGLEPTFFVEELEKVFGISIPDAEVEHFVTVRDFVTYIALSRTVRAGTA